MTKVYDNATDLITFARSSSGTALRRVGYGENLVDTANTASSWQKYGNNTVEQDGDAVKITYVDNSSGGFEYLSAAHGTSQDLVVGKVYKMTLKAKVSAGAAVTVRFYGQQTYLKDFVVSSDTYVDLEYTFVGEASHLINTPGMASGESIWLKDISVKEVIFDRATDDLVLFNHPDDIPRIEYAADGSLRGLLIEEQRTNLVTYSDFSSGWAQVRATLNATTQAGPDDVANSAVKMLGSSDNNTHFAYVNAVASGDRTISVFAKAAELDWLILANTGFASLAASYNLADGVTGDRMGTVIGFSDTSIEDAGGGWFRCSATIPSSTADGGFDFVVALGNGDNQYLFEGSASEGIYVYGAQLEVGSFPTSYIPTSGGQKTRDPDIASIPVSAFGYNQEAGTVVVEYDSVAPNTVTNRRMVSLVGNPVGNEQVSLYASSGNLHRGYVVDDGVLVSVPIGATGWTENQFYKSALTVDAIDATISVDGAVAVTDPTGSMPTIDTLALGSEATNGNYLNGHIKSLSYFPRRLTDAQLQELTS